ncbi:hypothetical protein T4A_144 [Trichinella pseudospiralis]|uniref:Uncharacterized protein n=1 Tax=Trichinella pseudospiralis TaxID=6337 RepID=A0A0V1EE73_TRIPS|nr:hypothetical protein T4A_144 [Trichinella pseudospiralis]
MLLELDVNLQMPEVFMTGMDKYNLKLLHSYLCCTVFPAAQKKFIYITFTTDVCYKWLIAILNLSNGKIFSCSFEVG